MEKKIGLKSFLFFLSISFVILTPGNLAFAEHSTASVSAPQGTSVPGCEDTNECFIPYEVTVDVGGTVTWTNDDSAAHTVTGGSQKDGPSGVFDSSLFMASTQFSHTFEQAGTFDYFCMVHPWMEGIVNVVHAQEIPNPPTGTDIIVSQGTFTPGCEKTNSCYIPFSYKALQGEKITWFNQDSAAHTVTSGSAANGASGEFDSSLFMGGTTFSHTFEQAGTFDYFCMVHPWMEGQVVIETKPEPVFNVKTEFSSYFVGDFIKVSGSASNPLSPPQISLRLIDPNNQKDDSILSVGSDNRFSKTLNSNNDKVGKWLIEIYFGGSLVASTSYTLLEPMKEDLDKDDDGIADLNDDCIDDKENFNGYQDNDGCPDVHPSQLDTDGDGIADGKDDCIDERENFNSYQDNDGCPDKRPNGIDPLWIVIGIVIAAAAGGAGLIISRSRKSSPTETIIDSPSSEKGRKCNVCGTIIPDGKNVCPNCGDAYS